MDELHDLLATMIGTPGHEERYRQRRDRYPELRALVPPTIHKVVTGGASLPCHGLGWRMATWSNEAPLARLNDLVARVRSARGWRKEAKHWGYNKLSNFDSFHQLLWILQCFEFFTDRGADVDFMAGERAAPDLRVSSPSRVQERFHVECYFYTKWWGRESFLSDLLRIIDPKLRIIRQYNIAQTSPFSPRDAATRGFLNACAGVMTPANLAATRERAKVRYPVVLHEQSGWALAMEGSKIKAFAGRRRRHGSPGASFTCYVCEIIRNKRDRNNLKGRRPNVLMVNGLGDDFQRALRDGDPADTSCLRIDPVDAVVVSSCGIDKRLAEATQVPIWLTEDHPVRRLLQV